MNWFGAVSHGLTRSCLCGAPANFWATGWLIPLFSRGWSRMLFPDCPSVGANHRHESELLAIRSPALCRVRCSVFVMRELFLSSLGAPFYHSDGPPWWQVLCRGSHLPHCSVQFSCCGACTLHHGLLAVVVVVVVASCSVVFRLTTTTTMLLLSPGGALPL